jgi:hypothetical protein
VPANPSGSAAFDLAAGDSLAWVAPGAGHIYRCSPDAGTCSSSSAWQPLAEVPGDVTRMIVAGAEVVWVEDRASGGAIRAAPLTPGATRTIVQANSVSDAVTDGVHLYFTIRGTANDGTVERCPLANCLAERLVLASGLASPSLLTLDATHVYFATNTDTSTIRRVVK